MKEVVSLKRIKGGPDRGVLANIDTKTSAKISPHADLIGHHHGWDQHKRWEERNFTVRGTLTTWVTCS